MRKEKREDDHQLKKLLTVEQILHVSTLGFSEQYGENAY